MLTIKTGKAALNLLAKKGSYTGLTWQQ